MSEIPHPAPRGSDQLGFKDHPRLVVDTDMAPGIGYAISPDASLAGSEELQQKFGVGFSGELKAIVTFAPGTPDNRELYVFDRGADTAGRQDHIYPPVDGKLNRAIMADDRYIFMLGLTQAEQDQYMAENGPQDHLVGRWGMAGLQAGSEIVIGKNDETKSLFRGWTAPEGMAQEDLRIHFQPDEAVVFTSLTWEHDTHITTPVVAARQFAA